MPIAAWSRTLDARLNGTRARTHARQPPRAIFLSRFNPRTIMQRAHLRPTGTSRHMHARSRDGRTIIKFVLRQESLELSWRDYLCAKLSRTGTSVHAADRIHSTSANGRDELLAGSQRRCAEQSHSHRRVCTQFVSAARTRARENECCDIVSVIGREREDKSACEEVPRKICTCARLMCWKL